MPLPLSETHPQTSAPDVLPLGLDSFLVRFATHGLTHEVTKGGKDGGRDHPAAVQAFSQALKDHRDEGAFSGIREVALALASVRVVFAPAQTDSAALRAGSGKTGTKPRLVSGRKPAAMLRRWHIPVAFGPEYAPQLAEVAALTKQTPEETIASLTAADLRVLAIGFAPGQPYIGLLPPAWDFPRQSDLTPQVPAGALTAALRQLVLFANPSPTGWRQIGLTAFRPFLANRNKPFLLEAGDALCFNAVSDGEMRALLADNT